MTTAAASAADPTSSLAPTLSSASPTQTPTPTPTTSKTSTRSSSPSGTASTPGPVTVIAKDLTTPWGLAFLPDGSALVTERDTAKIKQVSADGTVTEIGTVDGVQAQGEGGLLGIAVRPDFAQTQKILVYFTAADDDRLAEITFSGGKLTDQKVLLTGIAKANVHNGGRLAFGPDGLLYIGTGDATDGGRAQDVTSLNGKILRLTADGQAAPGNPFSNSPYVFSLGHRNVQGLAFDAQGRLWASEFGQDTWDELNLIKAGDNDGWPNAEGLSDDTKYVAPQQVWHTDDASPSGIAIAGGSVWMAALHGARLWRIPLTGAPGGAATGTPLPYFENTYGRLRTVVAAPDGSLWLTTSNTDGRGDPREGDDQILRVPLQ